MRKLKLFTLFAAMLLATSMWATIPIGSVDGVTGGNGSFRVWGWTIDQDSPSSTVEVHVYLYPVGSSNPVKGFNGTYANINRPDLNNGDPNSLGALYGTQHGFDRWINVVGQVAAGTYDVRVWAINIGSNEGNNVITYTGGGEVKTITISNPYTVSYNANNGSGAPSSQQKCTGINITLSNTVPTRTGYTFAGWNTAQNGSGTNYAKGATYSANASVTLYAKWTANKYTVTLDRQGGTGGDASCTATYGSAMPTVNIPGKSGYGFGGYYSQKNGGGKQYLKPGTSTTAVSNNNWDIASNSTLYAKWNINTYTLSYTLNGGTVASANPANYTVETASFTLNNPTREGFVFAGWTGSNGTTPQTSVSIAKGSTGNKSYTANWTPVNYTISYDLAGGEVSTANPANYTIETATFTLNNPTKANNTFLGWTGSNGETPQMEVSIAKGSTGDKNFVANWQENQAPEEPATSGIFDYNYDCSRNPAYPTKGNSCNLSGFSNPCVGLSGIGCGIGNNSAGPWKLEYVEMWNIDNSALCFSYNISSILSIARLFFQRAGLLR